MSGIEHVMRRLAELDREIPRTRDVLVRLDLVQERITLRSTLSPVTGAEQLTESA